MPITLEFYPKKSVKKVDFMNAMASVVQILHNDPKVDSLDIRIMDGKKIKQSFLIKLV